MIRDLIIRILAKSDGLKRAYGEILQDTKKLEQGLSKATKVSAVGFAGLAAGVGVSAQRFSAFEREFTKVVTLLDQGSFKTKTLDKGIEDLKNGVLDLSVASGESLDTLNKGLFDLISAGIPAEDSMRALADAADLAAAGGTDVATAVDGMTGALNAFRIPAEKSAQVSQKFFTAQKFGKTTIAELSNGFGLASASASAYGVSLEELLAATSAATLAGIKTNAAYTGLNAVLANIAKPTAEAKEEARRLGIEFTTTALRSKGLEQFLGDLTSANGFTQQSIEKLFGSVEAQKIAFALTGAQAEDFAKIVRELGHEEQLAATFAEALSKSKATLDKAFQRIKTSTDAALATLGEKFAPMIIDLADKIAALALRFRNMDSEQIGLIATIAKAGLAITAFTTVVLGSSLAFVKFIRLQRELRAVLLTMPTVLGGVTKVLGIAKAAWAVMWTAATGPIGLIVAGLALITTGIFKMVEANKAAENARNREAQKNELVAKTTARIQMAERALAEARKKNDKEEIARQEARLRFLRKAVGEVGRTGAVGGETLAAVVPGAAAPGKPAAGPDPAEKAKTEAIAQEIRKRMQAAREEREFLVAQREGASEEELAIIREKNELARAEEEAKLTLDDSLRARELENIQIHRDRLLEREKEAQERRREFDEEVAELDAEIRDALLEEDLEVLLSHTRTREQIESEAARKEVEKRRQAQRQKIEDERKFGKVFAAINAALHSETIKGFADTANRLAQLQNSKNDTLKAIGKAAAVKQIGVDTARGAVAAYASLAGIPLVGPVLGAAAAAALIAFGAEQTANVFGAQKGLEVRGVGAGDKVPALLERNEMVVPAPIAQQFRPAMAREMARQEGTGESAFDRARRIIVELELKDELVKFIDARIKENRALNLAS